MPDLYSFVHHGTFQPQQVCPLSISFTFQKQDRPLTNSSSFLQEKQGIKSARVLALQFRQNDSQRSKCCSSFFELHDWKCIFSIAIFWHLHQQPVFLYLHYPQTLILCKLTFILWNKLAILEITVSHGGRSARDFSGKSILEALWFLRQHFVSFFKKTIIVDLRL